jgi:clan AA aspartic protease (TIGR02281 family)
MEPSLAKSMSARSKLNRVSLVVRFTLILFVVSCAIQILDAFSGVFSYRDDKGAIHFTDDLSKIPKQYRENDKGVRKHREARGAHRSTPPPSVPLELPGAVSKNQEIQIPLIPVSGGNFLVDTILNGRIKARLMLDTGASLITLTEEIGRKLGISKYADSAELPFNTAGGEEWMPLVALETVTIGVAQTKLVEASINSHIKNIDGLLGMSFLGDFRFEIDRTNKRLTLKPPNIKGELAWDGKSGNWWQGRFEHYDTIIKSYSSRADFLKRRGHAKALNMKKTVDFYKKLRQKLLARASISGLPDRFRSSL